jgi:hypothetical protein
MPYNVTKTDGTAIVVLDGTKDTLSTSLTLFGRLAQNYGDQQNENFVRLLENFAFEVSPAFPIQGQLWFDKTSNNIKVYDTNNTWVTVGSVIQGNVDISGNLEIGSTGFTVKNITGDIEFRNSSNLADISFFSNVNGVSTRSLFVNGNTGLLEVAANATANFGLTTKIYVDSIIQAATSGGDTNLSSNVGIINANLASRVDAENALRANITAANAQIALRDTISRVDSINSAIDTAITSNVSVINANLAQRYNQTLAVETAMLANVNAANLRLTGALSTAGTGIQTQIDNLTANLNAVNVAKDIALFSNLALKADVSSPALSGVPTAPTAAFGANTLQIATTQYVMTRSVFWDGSRKFVSTADPSASDGNNGDIWFKYLP